MNDKESHRNPIPEQGKMKMADSDRNDFPDRPWTINEVAEYLSVSTRTIRNRMKDSELPHRYVGRDLRFLRDEVDQWVDRQPGAAA